MGGGGYTWTHRHKVRVPRDHLSNIDHRHTSRSKSIISMVTVGTVATGTCTWRTYLWVTLSVVLFRWHSSVYLASRIALSYFSRSAIHFFSDSPDCLILFTFSGPFLFRLCFILLVFKRFFSFQALPLRLVSP